MTLTKRLRAGGLALACSAAMALGAAAETPQPLSQTDAQRYAAAFDASDRGDFIDAQMQTTDLHDKSLLGYLSFRELMHPTAHKASFDELAGWLGKFRDLPLADRIFALAAKRKPAEAAPPPEPALASFDLAPPLPTAATDRGRLAREAFYSGDVRHALALAPAAGEHWIAGLAAYRLKDFALAGGYFQEVARDGSQDPWLRAAGAYWASRAATLEGDAGKARDFLHMAAQAPETFYGMIAERQTRLATAHAEAAAAHLTLAAYTAPDPRVARLIETDVRAHRAAALAQLGRAEEASQELRAGLALARTPAEKERWMALVLALGSSLTEHARFAPRRAGDADYPTPSLQPKAGFTIDPALVYAIVRQESRFNPLAVSPVGAVGLMQLMPEAAARAAGDDKLKNDMSPLLDPAFNLRVGQDYLTWLMERGVGHDILRTVAAYNGGPGTLQKTAQMLGDDADSLMIIECLPSLETRNYVEKVMAAYWTYKRMWGQEARTLEAVAGGARFVDARLDLADPRGAPTELPAQALQVGMR